MTTYSGRVESKYTVPASTTVSVSSGALTSAVSVTWPAASYFHTAAGGVSSGLTALTSAINAAVSPYPDNATSAAAMLGYGNFASGAGWGFNIASGNDTGLFGGVTMTAVSTPTYGTDGPSSATGDLAIGFDSTFDAFSAGNTFDVGATDDLILAWVGKFTSSSGSSFDFASKAAAIGSAGWALIYAGGSSVLQFAVCDGVDTATASCTIPTTSTWYAAIAVLERATNKARIAWRALDGSASNTGSEVSASAVGTLSNASSFLVGNGGITGAGPFTGALVAGLYVVKGSGVATGLSTALGTAVTNFANAVNSSFSVSMSTSTGLVTLSNSFWPCAMTMDDDTQSLLGYAYNVDYPQTAAQMATALGYGTWTSGAGYLCNESSGDLAAVFGTPATLTAVSTPTYGTLGPRGGTDKAVGFDSADDAFGGGDYFDVGATDDLIIAWVGYFSATPAAQSSMVSKGWLPGWILNAQTSGAITMAINDGVTSLAANSATTGTLPGEWHVGIAVVERAAAQARVGTYGLVSSTNTIGSAASTAGVGSLANASAFQIGDDSAALLTSPTTLKMAATYVVVGSGVAAGLSANLSTALGNFAAYMKSQTGTQQAKGVWFPDCPLSIEGDPAQAPKVTDRRSTVSPTGTQFSLVGNSYRRHRGVMWTHVPRASTWESTATYTNGSYETFANDCFYGLGHAWFTPASPVQIYWNDAGTQRAVGYTYNSSAGMAGWYVVNVDSTEPRPSIDGWTGLFRIEFGDIVGVGA